MEHRLGKIRGDAQLLIAELLRIANKYRAIATGGWNAAAQCMGRVSVFVLETLNA
jgi:hypothetical protein